jgi:hypothetical protein
LAAQGHEVINPALPDDDFDAAVRVAQAEFDRHQPDVVVGSSRGGAVAINIEARRVPLVLLCPAWRWWGTARAAKPGTLILHSPADDTIPFADSQELLKLSGLPETALVAVGHDHRLADPESLAAMLAAVEFPARDPAPAEPQPSRREAGVPRRFGIGVLLVITTMYAVLFGAMRACDCEPFIFALIAVFFTAVGAGQVIVFRGRRPRWASVVAGAATYPILLIWGAVHEALVYGAPDVPPDLCASMICGTATGAILGYIAGVLIAGVFLFIDRLAGRVVNRDDDRSRH